MVDPRELVINMIQSGKVGNPILLGLINSLQNGDTGLIETFAKNLYKTKGKDPNTFESDLERFKSNFIKR